MAYLLVDETEIYYSLPRGEARGQDQVIALMIHGGGGSSRHWEPLLAYLPEQYCPLLIDLPGHGKSGGLVPQNIDQAVLLLDHFLQQLEITRPVCCFGHSMGGLLAQYLALRFPGRVEKLVLIATAARIKLHADFVQAAVSGDWDLEMFRPCFGADIPLEIQNLVLEEYPRLRVDASTTDIMGLGAVDLRQEVSTLTVPSLVIVGDDDVIISPRHSRSLARSLKGATLLVIPGGGHYVHVEQPQQLAQALDQFMPVHPLESIEHSA